MASGKQRADSGADCAENIAGWYDSDERSGHEHEQADATDSGGEVDDPEWEQRDQAQRQEVAETVGFQPSAQHRRDAVVVSFQSGGQGVPDDDKQNRCPDTGPADRQETPPNRAEQKTARNGEHGSIRERQCRCGDICDQIKAGGDDRMGANPGQQQALVAGKRVPADTAQQKIAREGQTNKHQQR